MVLCLLTILGKDMKLTALARTQIVGSSLQQFFGIQTSFDSTGKVNFLLCVKKRDLTDLLEIVLNRVSCCTRDSNLLNRFIGFIRIRNDETAL